MLLHRTVSLTGRALGAVMIGCVHGYRLLFSPLLPPSCRYMPTCSGYAIEAIRRHGPIVGGALTARRLLRCHPWGGMGYDPVPEAGMARAFWARLRARLSRDVARRDTPTTPCGHSHHP